MTWPPTSKPKTARKPRGTPELDLQCLVAGFLRVATVPPARFWFVPNGANISKAQRGRFKDAGLTAGVADLHFMWSATYGCSGYGVIEMKAGRNTLDPPQEQFRDDVLATGHFWGEARSLDEVVSLLTAWEYPLRAKL